MHTGQLRLDHTLYRRVELRSLELLITLGAVSAPLMAIVFLLCAGGCPSSIPEFARSSLQRLSKVGMWTEPTVVRYSAIRRANVSLYCPVRVVLQRVYSVPYIDKRRSCRIPFYGAPPCAILLSSST